MTDENLPAESKRSPSQLLIADASPEDVARIEQRIRAYLRQDIWSLEEACQVCFGVFAVPVLRLFTPRDLFRSSFLVDYALVGIEAETLRIKKIRKGLFKNTLLVDPYEFGAWVAARPHIVGKRRAEAVSKILTRDSSAPASQSNRSKVFHSEFTSPALDAAFAAIVKFWLPHKDSEPRPSKDAIAAWLVEQKLVSSENAAKDIARVINPYPGTTESKKK